MTVRDILQAATAKTQPPQVYAMELVTTPGRSPLWGEDVKNGVGAIIITVPDSPDPPDPPMAQDAPGWAV